MRSNAGDVQAQKMACSPSHRHRSLSISSLERAIELKFLKIVSYADVNCASVPKAKPSWYLQKTANYADQQWLPSLKPLYAIFRDLDLRIIFSNQDSVEDLDYVERKQVEIRMTFLNQSSHDLYRDQNFILTIPVYVLDNLLT